MQCLHCDILMCNYGGAPAGLCQVELIAVHNCILRRLQTGITVMLIITHSPANQVLLTRDA